MQTLNTILNIVLIVLSIAMIAVVLMQQSKSAGLGSAFGGDTQSFTDRGYDTPNYTNVNYPFPVDPPHVPDANPSALYRREVYISAEKLEGREVYLNFEGVDSCFYLWVNDSFVGYSQVSHMTSEFNINDFVSHYNCVH